MAKLTPKQQRFADEYLVDLNATQAAKRAFGHLNGFKNVHATPDPVGVVINCIAILDSESAEVYQKKACLLLLKILTDKWLEEAILSDSGLFPISREDKRVRRWVKGVLAVGKCEICGSQDNLCAHHIIGWAEWPKGRIEPKNGQCLCIGCHAAVHKGDRCAYMMRAQAERAQKM